MDAETRAYLHDMKASLDRRLDGIDQRFDEMQAGSMLGSIKSLT